MRIIGCDLHAAQQSIAMLDRDTGEVVEKMLKHEADTVRGFYAGLRAPVVVGIEATGSMGWFLHLMDELGITCRVGLPARIRKAETRRQKHDRRDAALLLQLLVENRFPTIWMPSTELRDLRALLLHRHQWVRMRTRVQKALQAIALSRGLQRATRSGTLRARPRLRHCHCRRIRVIGAMRCTRCIGSWMTRSVNWMSR
jgi:transposase